MSSMLFAAAVWSLPQPTITAEEAMANAKAAFGLHLETEQQVQRCPDVERGENEIVVCRQFEDPQELRVPHEVDADSGAPRAPDLSPPCTGVCIKFGKVPEYPPIIDLKAIPEAPPGSDADRLYGWHQDGDPPPEEAGNAAP